MIEALLEAGWDPTRRSPDGKTPREIALGLGLEGIASRLLRAEERWRLGRAAGPGRGPGKPRGV